MRKPYLDTTHAIQAEVLKRRHCWQDGWRVKDYIFPTAGPVGFQSLGLGLGRGDLQPSKSGMEPWNPGTLEPWKSGTLEPWNPGILEPWNPGIAERWNPGTLEPWNPGSLDLGTLLEP